ncbi:hypothetical protein E2C01_068882 [Portunus trituberculatus]|uniref:Uncharacterized protein n=1 Tax=Portunus trituberculatus TaxID=210409 RepID=A0A5B7HT67_PORTR|nr:hypothetical protein [Portunus trituberculatus]
MSKKKRKINHYTLTSLPQEVMSHPWRLAVVVVVVTCVVQSVCVGGQSLPHPSTAEWSSTHTLNTTDFPAVLWYGFSSNKVNFTRDDLQHLVECTLGHHHCPPLHQSLPSVTFSSCDKESGGKSSHCRLLEACTVDDLLSAMDHDGESLSVEDLRELLPVITYMGQKGDSCTTQQLATAPKSKPSPSEGECLCVCVSVLVCGVVWVVGVCVCVVCV